MQLAIASLEEGLATLASLGHPFHLEDGVVRSELGWPRILFNVDSAPNGRLVNSEYDARELGPGWYDTANDAQHADGLKTQFAGRGGIGVRNVPAISAPLAPPSPNDNSARIAAWKLEKIKSLLEGTADGEAQQLKDILDGTA